MGTNPWGDPCDKWCYPPLNVSKSVTNGGAHRLHPWEENMVQKPRNEMQIENILNE